ncbi:HD domain-containing phosphohydrolase [Orrella sp. 11846]|uniref:HD domain-containing phosphohydrolase n=1 Tax=Orrella sp. 11846 TaxID=3409913 RepID=UPI003B5A0514
MADVPVITQDQPQQALLSKLIELMISLSGQRDIALLYVQIIEAAQRLTGAQGGTLYTVDHHEDPPCLRFEVVNNTELGVYMGAGSEQPVTFAPVPLYLPEGTPNKQHVCAYTFHSGRATRLPDVYEARDFDFSGTRQFDQSTGYRSKSMFTLPLINHEGDVIGVLQLLNAQDPTTGEVIPFGDEMEAAVGALASAAAITLNNQILLKGHKDLLDAFVQVIAQAIDAKSAHTSGHCQRVPHLTSLLAQAACDATEGPLVDFSLTEDEWYELHVASWLHDCGKLSTPDTLLDKATKLQLLTDSIETIKARFAALIAQTQLNADDPRSPEVQAQVEQLQADCVFLEKCNLGAEFMREEDQARVKEIATHTWVDVHGQEQPILTPDEVSLLCISRGTLSAQERERINDHIVVTINMLEALPFPRSLQRVPEYAGGHHERVDGRGYPKGLRGEEMSWPARMMAIADVFEALTAQDRPYKEPMKLSQALSILRNMAQTGHLDPDLYQLFIEHGVWLKYADEYLQAAQIDVSDASEYALTSTPDQ